jgi:hypothetical protein
MLRVKTEFGSGFRLFRLAGESRAFDARGAR